LKPQGWYNISFSRVIIGFISFSISFCLAAEQPELQEAISKRFGRIWSQIPQEKVYLHTDKYQYSAGETIWLKAYIVNATTHSPDTKSQYIYVELLDSAFKTSQRLKLHRKGVGAHGSFKLAADFKPGEYTLRGYTYWMQNAGTEYFFHKKISVGNLIDTRMPEVPKSTRKHSAKEIPISLEDDFDVQFFPESGSFLSGIFQLITFKAIGSDGLSVDVKGAVFNQMNEEVTLLESSHRGMGKLMINALPGDQFYAIVRNSSGKEKRFVLPAPEDSGIGLHLAYNRGKINILVANTTRLPADSLYLMIHSRGKVLVLSEISTYEALLSENLLPEGIVSFSIIDASAKVWCERLFFSRNFIHPLIGMKTDRREYLQRDPVELTFSVQRPDSLPLQAHLSVSITDSYHVKSDTLNNTIQSFLLLNSDLKGYVEAPQEYFADNSLQTREKTDLLMLTQGWKRFNTAAVAKGQHPINTSYLEIGQALTGKVLNLFNKPVRNSTVVMMNRYNNKIRFTTTDSLGRYYIDGIEFADSTRITLKAISKSRMVDVEILPDSDAFPAAPTHLPVRLFDRKAISDDYLKVTREKYYLEGGMMVINLDEVTVSAEKKSSNESNSYYSGMADNRLDAKQLEPYQNMQLLQALSMIPGVVVSGETITIRGSTGEPLILIDGMEVSSIEDIAYMNVSDVEEIMVFKGASASIFGVRGGNGVIAFTLRQGYEPISIISPSLIHLQPLGFHVADEFYMPRYDVDSIRMQNKVDLRTTIYWNPDVQTNEQGEATVRFFTADNPNNYTVELEGIGIDGSICRYRGIVQRK